MEAILCDRPHAEAKPTDRPSSFATDDGRRPHAILDPLDADDAADEIVLTTRRAISRVALVAAETGGRFQRDGVQHDPMAWLLAPRQVFDGRAAVEACLARDDCMRGILIHGLGLGLDADRAAIDALLVENPEDANFGARDFPQGFSGEAGEGASGRRGKVGRTTRLRLYTATLADTRDNVLTQAFHASVARNVGEVRARLAGRFGPDLARVADIRVGVHTAMPLVVALVPAAVVEMIQHMEREVGRPATRHFAVDIQQCIQG